MVPLTFQRSTAKYVASQFFKKNNGGYITDDNKTRYKTDIIYWPIMSSHGNINGLKELWKQIF